MVERTCERMQTLDKGIKEKFTNLNQKLDDLTIMISKKF